MMGIQPGEAKRLTYWEFTAMRETWNQRHHNPDNDPLELPSEEFVRAAQEELHELGIAGKAVN